MVLSQNWTSPIFVQSEWSIDTSCTKWGWAKTSAQIAVWPCSRLLLVTSTFAASVPILVAEVIVTIWMVKSPMFLSWLNQQESKNGDFPWVFCCFFPIPKKKCMAMYGLLPGHTSRIRHSEAMTASVAVTLVLPLDMYYELLETHQNHQWIVTYMFTISV